MGVDGHVDVRRDAAAAELDSVANQVLEHLRELSGIDEHVGHRIVGYLHGGHGAGSSVVLIRLFDRRRGGAELAEDSSPPLQKFGQG